MNGSTLSTVQIHCACGCSMWWKGFTSSPNRYYSESHARRALLRKPSGAFDFAADGHKGESDLAKKKAREMDTNGMTARQIARQLNAMGLRTGRGAGFTTSDVLKLLECEEA